MIMIETNRLKLRAIALADKHHVFAYRGDAETNKYQGWIPDSLEDTELFISKNPAEFNIPDTWFQLVILDKSSDTLIGDIGVHFLHTESEQVELGITLNKEYHSQGYATEALNGVLEYLFLKLKKTHVLSSVDRKNAASIRLMDRLGLKKQADDDEAYMIQVNEWQKIEKPVKTDYQELIELWEKSVRATHDFLANEDIEYFRPLILNNYFDAVTLYCTRNFENTITGFVGVADQNIEMLFIDPKFRGQGIGKKLLDYAIANLDAKKVDVNKQNDQAVGFYLHYGFKVVAESPLDSSGKPYPILHMAL